MLNYLSTTSRRHAGEWIYRSMCSCPRHYLEVSGQFHASAALPLGKEPPAPMGLRAGLDDVEKRKFLTRTVILVNKLVGSKSFFFS
jgi:hypothetical protein